MSAGYTRVWQGTGQVMDVVDLHLPDFMFETQATYLRVPRSARVEAETLGLDFRAGLHAAGHALLNVLPLFLICNPKDVGTECEVQNASLYIASCLADQMWCWCCHQNISLVLALVICSEMHCLSLSLCTSRRPPSRHALPH